MRSRSALILLFAASCATAPEYHGPMAVRNQHPAQLSVLHMDPADTVSLPARATSVHWNTAYSNLFLAGQNPTTSFEMDGELMRTALGLEFGLGGGWELGIELPFIHSSGGFLDEFVVKWHEAFGLPDQGRQHLPRNRFLVKATHQGNTVYEVEETSLALADVPIVLGFSALEPSETQPYGLAFRAGIELPTGDDNAGFGNGGLDFALGLVGEWRIHPVAFTTHLQHSFAATPDRYEASGFDYGDVSSAGIGLELALSDDSWLLLQTEWETSTLRGLDLARTAKEQWLLWGGLRFRVAARTRLELALAEDLSTFIAPDFSLWLGITHDFGILR